MATYDWNLRANILESAHRWPVIMLFVLIGSLLGGLFAYLLPTLYRAEVGLQVTYNADIHPRNPDDFKNWQMEQLDVLIHSDEVLQATLTRLQAQDPSWNSYNVDVLRPKVHTYWRNAGEWRLVAEAQTSAQADALVSSWEQVVLEQLSQALAQASSAFDLSTRMDSVSDRLVELKADSARLGQIQRALESWKGLTVANSQPLSELDRWQLTSQVTQIAGWDPAGLALLGETPPPDADSAAYTPWIEKALALIASQLDVIGPQTSQLQAEYDQLYAAHAVALNSSRGLTSYLSAESLDYANRSAQQIRPVSQMVFIGGLLGLLAWALYFIARPMLQRRQASI